MAAILGKKLGMTQVFDPETGGVTPVTVIAAGPCPVVQVKTRDLDGYDAVQLAFDSAHDRRVMSVCTQEEQELVVAKESISVVESPACESRE